MANNNKITIYATKIQKEAIYRNAAVNRKSVSQYLKDLGMNMYPEFMIEMKDLMNQVKRFLEEEKNENNKRRTSLT